MATTTTSAPADLKPAPVSQRRRQLTLLAAVVGVGVVLFILWSLIFGGRTVETDNAYVGAEVSQVTPLISGPVSKVLVLETQVVKAGQPLIVLDDADARIGVAQAQAALGQAERHVKGYFANDAAFAGQVDARAADLIRADAQITLAKAELDRARTDLSRREALASSGAVSTEELTTARTAAAGAQANLASAEAARSQAVANRTAAQGAREANSVMISGAPVEQNPEVAAARARLDSAKLALERTVLRAPADGVIAKKAVQVGQQVQVGQPLMVVVPTARGYVDANFKEVQLKKVHAGQSVELTSDLYGSGVKFHGVVRGLSGGTGSAFSLIPAQNASGNWIKVVQRLPVRVDLDPRDLAVHPLQVGLSMKAKINVAGR